MNLGVVVSEFNSEITRRMLIEAKEYAKSLGINVEYVCYSPGAFDMPLIVRELLRKDNIHAVVTLGAIVKGETKHDEVIAFTLAKQLSELSLEYGKPVALGVSGPGMSWEQGLARASEYARRAVDAALKAYTSLGKLRGGNRECSWEVK